MQPNKYLNQIQSQQLTLLNTMPPIITGLFKWSLEITGVTIVWFNYQSYERQQKIIGIYHFLQNSYRGAKCVYALYRDFQPLTQLQQTQQDYNSKLAEFKSTSARRIQQLCQKNRGVYGRMGQILAGMANIVPDQYRNTLQQLDKAENSAETPYENIKTALTASLHSQMKQVFDGFQTKPLKSSWFTQTHKAILLQNYREVIVKVIQPSTLVQGDHDIWFINKCKETIINYLQKHNFDHQKLQVYNEAIQQAERETLKQLNLQNQNQTYQNIKQIIYDHFSATYIPFYFSKYLSKNVIIREFVQGIPINDVKALKEMKITPEVAFAYVLSQVQHMMKKYNLINASLSQNNILIRKYVKPVKPMTGSQNQQTAQPKQEDSSKSRRKQAFKNNLNLVHPPIQVVFLNQKNYEPISEEASQSISDFWSTCKKSNKKIIPSISSFYERVSFYQKIKSDPKQLLASKIYLYQPIIRMYEKLVATPPAAASKSK